MKGSEVRKGGGKGAWSTSVYSECAWSVVLKFHVLREMERERKAGKREKSEEGAEYAWVDREKQFKLKCMKYIVLECYSVSLEVEGRERERKGREG